MAKIDMIRYIVKFTLLIIIICASKLVNAQSSERPYTAYQVATAYQRSYVIDDYRGVANPALLSRTADSPTVFFSSEKRYFSDINGFNAGVAIPLSKNSGISFSLSDYGFDIWRENSFSIQYGRKLSNSLSIGSTLSGHQLRLSEFGSTFSINVELGLLYQVDDSWSISALIENFNSASNQEASSSYILASQYKVSPKVTMTLEASLSVYEANSDIFLSYALQYSPADPLLIIIGIHTNAAAPSIGLHWRLSDKVGITVAASRHRYLGSTGSFGLTYKF